MGQGGTITIVNSTEYDFRRIKQTFYQMNSWNFPEIIPKMSHVVVYVEWEETMFKTWSDDFGEAVYKLEGTEEQFQIKAQAKQGYMLEVYFDTLSTQTVPQKQIIRLGWIHDGNVSFILSGKHRRYFSNGGTAEYWMKNNEFLLGNKTLKDICIVGSHNSGMSIFGTGKTAFAHPANTLTQSCSIGEQLKYGARYFDIRPVLAFENGNPIHYTGHYGHIPGSWQGVNGQSLSSIIDEVNRFASGHNELIILNISHTLNTTLGCNSYRPFTQAEWNELLDHLCYIRNRFYDGKDNSAIDLTKIRLGDFIRNASSVVITIDDRNIEDKNYKTVDLSQYKTKGIFSHRNFRFYDKYSETNDFTYMSNDQLTKMKQQSTSTELFTLSWTLTQNNIQAATGIPSIKDLAFTANQHLSSKLYPEVNNRTFPNIIYIDEVKTTEAVAMAMAVNSKILR